MSERATDATNVTPADPVEVAKRLRAMIPLLVVGICPLCEKPISRREAGDYKGTPTHRYCSVLQQLTDTNDDLARLREEFKTLRSYLVGPIPREAH